MKANYKIAIALVAGITIGGTTIASAQSLKSKIVGGWTLVEGSEIMADGKKVVPWAKGSLIIDRDGQISFFVLGKDGLRPTACELPQPRWLLDTALTRLMKPGKSTRPKLRERAHQPSKVLYASRRSRSKTTP